jgi:SAM-dependent methyltransferase
MPELDRTAAWGWIDRWDRQQREHLPDREDRFAALIDAVEAGVGRPDPLVVDLGCGPGSLSVRLLDRLPRATVVAVDADPVTLALGRATYGGRAGLRFAELDLRTPGWSAGLGLDTRADAAVSTTALHWLSGPELRAMYAELATVLRPGGLLLDGDHLGFDEADSPTLARLAPVLSEQDRRRRHPGDGSGETWSQWWEAVAADPALAGLAAERARRAVDGAHHGSVGSLLATHTDALRAAGFGEIGTLWQRGDNRLLCAVLAS